MIYLASAAVFVAGFAIVALFSALQAMRQMVRGHARERDVLIDKIMHLAGQTWTPPPSAAVTDNGFDPDAEIDDRFTTSPTQLPDY